MRKILALIGLQFRITYKSKATVATFFGMPLLFAVIFGYAMGSSVSGEPRGIPFALVVEEESFAARTLTEVLKEQRLLEIRTVDRADMALLFAAKQVASGAVIPAGFQKGIDSGTPVDVELVRAPGGNMETVVAPAVTRATSQVAADYRLARWVAGPQASDRELEQAYARVQSERGASGAKTEFETVRREVRPESSVGSVGQASLGFSVMFVMMLVMMQGGTILQERQAGTWGRLLTTPTSRFELLAGYLLSFFITGVFQFIILWQATRFLFGASWGPALPLLTMASALVLCSAGLGLFLAGLVRTVEQQRTIGMVLVSATSMLGGVYWPLEFVSPLMQRIGYMTPQAWAMEGLREVMLRGGSWPNLVWPLAVLLGLSVVFTGVGLLRVRFE